MFLNLHTTPQLVKKKKLIIKKWKRQKVNALFWSRDQRSNV